MPSEFEIIQLQVNEERLKALPNRQRNQIIACMHAHNELAVMNRLLMFSLNDVGEGELHDHAHSVQMWCIMQLLAGKVFETWKVIFDRFLKSNPEDPAVASLKDDHERSLAWLRDYFAPKDNALRIIRDKSAFHYDDGLNLDDALAQVSHCEQRVYVAQHPANGLYYVGSALVFRTVFAMVADKAGDTKGLSQVERMNKGVRIVLADLREANFHLHGVLYGLISMTLFSPADAPLAEPDQLRIPVADAPAPKMIALPMFLNMD